MLQKLSTIRGSVGFWISLLTLLFATACSGDDAPASRVPELSITESVNGLSSTQVTLEGYVQTNGANIGRCGFLLNKERAVLNDFDEGSAYSATLNSDGTVKLQISSLTPQTTYYFCLFVKSGSTTLKSSIGSFTTSAIVAPTFSSVQLVQATETELTVKCQVANSGGQAMSTFGFDYKLQSDAAFKHVPVDKFDAGSTDNTFTAVITELAPGTDYIVRAKGFNGVMNGYSEEVTLTTLTKTSPTVTIDIPESNVGATYVTPNAQIVATGDAAITERGFLIAQISNPVVGGSGVTKVDVDVATSGFSTTIDNLSPTTTYYVRAFAANKPYDKTQYGYSEVKEITTSAFVDPSFGQITEQLVDVSLKVACSVNSNGVNILEKGFCYSKTNMKPEVDNTSNTIQAADDMEATFPIEENTTYYVRAYVKYNRMGSVEICYSDTHTSKKYTFARPSFTEISYSNVTIGEATLSAVFATNGASITEKGFVWGTSSGQLTSTQTVEGEFETTISNLNANTTYYFKAYVIYKLGEKNETLYSSEKNFTTQEIQGASVSNPTVSDITFTTATVTSSITNQGEGVVKSKGFCWIKTNGWGENCTIPTLTTCDGKVELSADEAFTYTITGLTAGTVYAVRSYVVSEAYGQTITSFSEGYNYANPYGDYPFFQTETATLAYVATPEEVEVTENMFKVSSSIIDEGNTAVTEVGFCWSDQDIEPEQMTQVVKATREAFILTVSEGLKAGGTYYIYAYAVNGGGKAYSGMCTVTLKSVPNEGDNPFPDLE